MDVPVRHVDLPSVRVAVRVLGQGPPLVMLHGWPFSSLTYRRLAPLLAERFTCYLPDIPGTGETEWTDETPFAFRDQALTMRALFDRLGLDRYALLAHDTGATLARLVALGDARVSRLALLNTEIPGHRPPWIPLYGKLFRLPGAASVLRALLGSDAFRRSSAGFGGCFHDPALLDEEFLACFVDPVRREPRRAEGLRRYLLGFDWTAVDDLDRGHAELKAPVLLVWGADDPTFPLAPARAMAARMPTCAGIRVVERAELLPHEEHPEEVARHVIEFLG